MSLDENAQADNEEHCVIACASIHDVLALERALIDAGLWCELIPTPRQISSDCGMALQARHADLDGIVALHDSRALEWDGAYRLDGEEYKQLKGI